MIDTIISIYRDISGDYNTIINPKTKIKGGLRLTSLGMAQLICEIEDRFDIEISVSELKSIKTIQDFADYLEKKIK